MSRWKTEKKKSRQQLKFLVGTFYDFQESRKAFDNRVRNFFEEKGKYDNRIEEISEESSGFENRVENLIQEIVSEESIFTDYLDRIKGIGPVMAGNLIGRYCTWREATIWKNDDREPTWYQDVIDETSDKWVVEMPPVIEVAEKVTNFWSYCGLTPDDKREKGKKLNHDPVSKELFTYKLPSQFARAQSRYNTEIKSKKKNRLMKRDDIDKKGHAEGIARTIVGKVFASHFWYVFRNENGMETPSFYHCKHLDNHDTVINPFVEQPEYEEFDIDFD